MKSKKTSSKRVAKKSAALQAIISVKKAAMVLGVGLNHVDWATVDEKTLDWGLANPEKFGAQMKEFFKNIVMF